MTRSRASFYAWLRLVKRQHSCDTWDNDIKGAGDGRATRHVIATCGQSRYMQAYEVMAAMHRHLGLESAAERCAKEAEVSPWGTPGP